MLTVYINVGVSNQKTIAFELIQFLHSFLKRVASVYSQWRSISKETSSITFNSISPVFGFDFNVLSTVSLINRRLFHSIRSVIFKFNTKYTNVRYIRCRKIHCMYSCANDETEKEGKILVETDAIAMEEQHSRAL